MNKLFLITALALASFNSYAQETVAPVGAATNSENSYSEIPFDIQSTIIPLGYKGHDYVAKNPVGYFHEGRI